MVKKSFETFLLSCKHSKEERLQHLFIILSHLPVLIEECAKEGKMTCIIKAKNFGLPESALIWNRFLIEDYLQADGYTVGFEEVFMKEYQSITEMHIHWDLLK